MTKLAEIRDLHVSFRQHEGNVQAVRGVSFHIDEGESLGIVGESGSGKSVTCMALMRLLREPPAQTEAAALTLDGVDLLKASKRQLADLRGRVAALVFQDPMSSFDPVFTIGHQLSETIRTHRKCSKADARSEAEASLERVEIRNAATVYDSYPHQLSGGMLQRAMIAMALSCQPRLLIADEPTTALDVTIQAQILQLIKDLQAEFGMGLIMITHDLGVIAETVDRVVVLYGGKVMEEAPVITLFDDARHPYTQALLRSVPGQTAGRQRLIAIEGASPNPASPPAGCPFSPRCDKAEARCAAEMPALETIDTGRKAACWRLS
ncbi:ABC transporter ATP-binding protein [Martelella sp. HB161492]|uniref:ABC transporter ATP-binding protein n=1 Tax=Martelella sp. HB161492 TaxID=2720726 RepID=UPI001AEE9D0B|nr:ABC transporter ATP-binding protein [Martelella sp. HB161492]